MVNLPIQRIWIKAIYLSWVNTQWKLTSGKQLFCILNAHEALLKQLEWASHVTTPIIVNIDVRSDIRKPLAKAIYLFFLNIRYKIVSS
jgi:hypothetical protein